MRIILATLLTLFVTAILILTARIWGMGQHFAEFSSPFFASDTPLIIVKADTLAKVEAAIKLKPQAVIWADVRVSKGKVPFVLPPSRDVEFLKLKDEQQKANPSTQIMMGSKLSDYSWEQINEFYKNTPTLKEYYEKFPQTRFILNVVDNVPDVHSIVTDTIQSFSPDNRTMIQSDALVIIQAIKDLKAAWVYGTSVPDLMRFLSFDSLYILPATQFKGDVFVAPFKIMKRDAFNKDIIEEMRRRHKPVYLGPIDNADQLKMALGYKADGLITENLPQLLQLMETSK